MGKKLSVLYSKKEPPTMDHEEGASDRSSQGRSRSLKGYIMTD